MQIINGAVFSDDGAFHRLSLATNGELIGSLGAVSPAAGPDVLDAEGCYVVPGLVDIHIHGAMGADFSDGTADAVETISRYLLTQGVTSFLGTSMALPEARLAAIYAAARPLIGQTVSGCAALRGINMEGPFFNPEKRGAQNPRYIIPPDFGMFSRLNEASGGNIRTVAIAPEREGGLEFTRRASKVCSVSLGHSCADYETAREALSCGASHITHLFNGMPPFHHRDPGIVGAAADSGAYAELICDGLHLHPAMVRSVFRLFGDDRVCLISDSMRACGMPDGRYDLGGQAVTVAGGAATIAGGSLAGSVTVLTDCLRRAVQFGIPLESALKASTVNPAKSVGLDAAVGSLTPGKRADIVIFNRDLSIRRILFSGRIVA